MNPRIEMSTTSSPPGNGLGVLAPVIVQLLNPARFAAFRAMNISCGYRMCWVVIFSTRSWGSWVSGVSLLIVHDQLITKTPGRDYWEWPHDDQLIPSRLPPI